MAEPVRHRQTKGAETDMFEPKATASHLDSTLFGHADAVAACLLLGAERTSLMPLFLFHDNSVEIACPRCGMTAPKTIAWLCANHRYRCAACDFEFYLALDKRV